MKATTIWGTCGTQGYYCEDDYHCCGALECIGFECTDSDVLCGLQGGSCEDDFHCCGDLECIGFECAYIGLLCGLQGDYCDKTNLAATG